MILCFIETPLTMVRGFSLHNLSCPPLHLLMPKRVRKQRNKAPPPRRRSSTVKPKSTRPRKAKGFSAVRLGQRLGNVFSPAIGRVGAEAGRLFKSVTGYGDYKVNKNTLMNSDPLPTFKNLQNGTRVIHREYLNDVITSPFVGVFTIQTVPIQPALTTSFPWLAASAENYQEYRINGLIYEFKSNSYDALASTNTASGTVVMSTDYNVLDAPFPNKFQMEQSQYTSSSKPSKNLMHPIECAKLETPASVLFTRPGPVTTGDLRLYDWGNFYIATVGMQGASTNIGELWATYDITLLKPKLGSTVDVQDHYVLNPLSTLAGGTNYFGTTAIPPVKTLDSDMGTSLIVRSPSITGLNTIVWPAGYTGNVAVVYVCSLTTTSSAGISAIYTQTVTGGVQFIPAFGLGTSSAYFTNQGNSLVYNNNGGTTLVMYLSITNGGSVTLANGGPSAILISADLFVIALPSNFNSLGLPPITFETHQQSVIKQELKIPGDIKHSTTRSTTPDDLELVSPSMEECHRPFTLLRSMPIDIPPTPKTRKSTSRT